MSYVVCRMWYVVVVVVVAVAVAVAVVAPFVPYVPFWHPKKKSPRCSRKKNSMRLRRANWSRIYSSNVMPYARSPGSPGGSLRVKNSKLVSFFEFLEQVVS